MATPGTPGSAPGDQNWTTQVADRIVSTVDTLRGKATVPAQTAARAVVWGIVVLIAALVALYALVVGLFRGLYIGIGLLPWVDNVDGRSVWIVDLVVGLAFTFVGLTLLGKASKPKPAKA